MKNNTRKALLISPYLDTLGGGEQHILSILRVIADHGYKCHIKWHQSQILRDAELALGISTEGFEVVDGAISTSEYDICLYVTDGSYFLSRSKRSIIFFMYPSKAIFPHSLLSRFKTARWDFLANGPFTSEMLEKLTDRKAEYIAPYISDEFVDSGKKTKQIMTAGRFFPHLHSKRQDIFIEAIINLIESDKNFAKYSCVLAGGLSKHKQDISYFHSLQKRASGYKNIKFYPNVSRKKLINLYADSDIYIHTAGYCLDEEKEMENVEHMGITPLEAMASGCVTVCHASGGPKRYIDSGVNGFLYETIEELIACIKMIDAMETSEKKQIAKNAKDYVRKAHSYEVFKKHVMNYFNLS